MSINKRFTCLITLLFLILGNLKAQDYKVDFRKVSQLLSVSQERDRIASEALEDVKSRRLRMEEDLMDAQDNPKSVSKEDKKKLENDIKVLRKKEEELAAKQKETTILLMIVTDMLQASPKKRANFLEGYEKRFGVIRLDSTGQNSAVATTVAPSVETPKITKKNKTAEPVV